MRRRIKGWRRMLDKMLERTNTSDAYGMIPQLVEVEEVSRTVTIGREIPKYGRTTQ